jgi:D-hydroxyproline dehydrogenase subunit gamma
MKARFVRLAETHRRPIRILVDGVELEAREGDTVTGAILTNLGHLRTTEFGHERRAGFCMMGACQDCWVWTADSQRLRACTTTVSAGLSISTKQPEAKWTSLA